MSVSARGRTELAAQGGVELVTQAMHNDPQDPRVMIQCCALVRNLAEMNKGLILLWVRSDLICFAANAARIVQACHGIELLVVAMREFADDPALQEAACGALRNIMHDDCTYGMSQTR